jgi:hypothetical protein
MQKNSEHEHCPRLCCAPYVRQMAETEPGGTAEVKPNPESSVNNPQPITPENTTRMFLRQILATPICTYRFSF